MKFNVVHRNDDVSIKLSKYLIYELESTEFIFEENNPEIVFSIGGDGTMLQAIHQYINKTDQIHFCGIHTGTLGFYTDFLVEEIDLLIEKIKTNDFNVIEFNMLEVNVYSNENKTIHYALNEGRIENNQHTQVLEVEINDEYFETIRGNGLNFSTPTGSTGYNKSLGGSIMHPKTCSMQMCEIASINNNVYRSLSSPLILAKEHLVSITSDDFEDAVLGIDHLTINLNDYCNDIDKITFQLSNKTIKFARYRTLKFLNRVQKHFI